MADLAPLSALRFASDTLPQVLAPPYDVINALEREVLAARSPHNIVHLDLPLGDGDSKYENAARLFRTWIQEGVLRQDSTPRLLRYEQEFEPPGGGAKVTRKGFFALVRAESYETRAVLPHERTLSGPKEDRYKLFLATKAALSPVFFLYTDPTGSVAQALSKARVSAEFVTWDGIHNRLAELDDPPEIAKVVGALKNRSLLIADGHHRYETTVRYAQTVSREDKSAHPRGAHLYVLAYLADADDPGLMVFPTHRLVHSLADFDRETLLQEARSIFDVRETSPASAGEITHDLEQAGIKAPSVTAIFPDGKAYLLSLRADVDVETHPAWASYPQVLRRSDVVVLHASILEAILGITRDMQEKYMHIRYLKSTPEAMEEIRSGEGNVLFLMNPTPVQEVRRVCEAGEVMPQKSTYFYPKVPTGLAIHVLDPSQPVG